MQTHLRVQQAKTKARKERELKFAATIPTRLCFGTGGLLRQHCRHRKPDDSCRFVSCRYNIATNQLPIIEKELLSAAYSNKRRN